MTDAQITAEIAARLFAVRELTGCDEDAAETVAAVADVTGAEPSRIRDLWARSIAYLGAG